MERENKKERSFTFLSYLIGIRRGRRGNARFFFLFEGKDGILLDEGVDYDEGERLELSPVDRTNR